MIKKRTSTFSAKRFNTVVIASAVLVVLIASLIITNIVIAFKANGDKGGSTLPEVDTEIGESLFGGMPIAYPTFDSKQVKTVSVSYYEKDDEEGEVLRNYSIVRPSKDSEFDFYYTDTNGNAKLYRPEIYYTDGFNPTDFYASTGTGGYNIYRISYLLVALSVVYFDEKIPIPEDTEEKSKLLNRYGLTADERQSINFSYYKDEERLVEHTIHIGDFAIDGSGYYFTVDDRPFIYNSTDTGFDYALDGFLQFLHSRLTAQGLPMDASQEPYFTQDYKQWKNELHNDKDNKDDKVIYGSEVVFSGSSEEYRHDDNAYILNYLEDDYETGISGTVGKFSFKMDSSTSKKIRNILIGKPVGRLDVPLSVTLVGDSNWAMLDGRYRYTFKSIDAILTDEGADITAEGTPVGDARYIKVTYDYKFSYLYTEGHFREYEYEGAKAIVDLQKIDTGIPEEVNSAFKVLQAGKIGKLSEAEQSSSYIDITYTEENSDKYETKYVVTDIDVILAYDDKGVAYYDTEVRDKSVVNYRYSVMHGEEVLTTGKRTVDLGVIKDDGGIEAKIKEKLLGKGLGTDYSITAYSQTLYREHLADYMTYTAEEINYFVTESLITSFEFVNASERNPFYAESLFKNTLTDKNKIYAIDSTASEYVVRLLGGISLESSSQTSEGLKGAKTVAVGLTPENMLEYGLYANTIYFEIPRGIEFDKLKEGDYKFLSSLGFTLYISDLLPDGSRYIGSDMYDIVAQIDGAPFAFLDQSFVEFWARESLAAVSYEKIDDMSVEFYMNDLKGSYDFDVQHNKVWIYGDQTLTTPPEEGGQAYDQIRLEVTANDIESATDSLFKQMLIEGGTSSKMLYHVYARATGTNGMYYRDTMGGVNFKSLLSVIFNTYYTGSFEPTSESDEQKNIIKKENLLMRMSFGIDDENFSDTYYYEFYSADDRRIMVRIYAHGESANAVSDFYISPLAFKKIAKGFVALLNGQTVVEDEGFAD